MSLVQLFLQWWMTKALLNSLWSLFNGQHSDTAVSRIRLFSVIDPLNCDNHSLLKTPNGDRGINKIGKVKRVSFWLLLIKPGMENRTEICIWQRKRNRQNKAIRTNTKLQTVSKIWKKHKKWNLQILELSVKIQFVARIKHIDLNMLNYSLAAVVLKWIYHNNFIYRPNPFPWYIYCYTETFCSNS